jgi:hypothetical protein
LKICGINSLGKGAEMNEDVKQSARLEDKDEFCPVAMCRKKIKLFIWFCGRKFEGGHLDSCPRADDTDDRLPYEELYLIFNRRAP